MIAEDYYPQVGDKVKILPRNGSQEDYYPQYIDGMLKYVGQLAIITQVMKTSCNIDLDDGMFHWPYEALQLVNSEMDKTINPNELKNGDYIKITNTATDSSSIYIFREVKNNIIYRHADYSLINKSINVNPDICWLIGNATKITYATEEERKLLDKALLEQGFRWNSSTKQLESIGVVDLPTNDLTVQSVLCNSIYDSIQKVDSIFEGTPNCAKKEKQTKTELNLFPKKKHYQLNFNY